MRELAGIAVALLTLSTPDGSAPEIRETTRFWKIPRQPRCETLDDLIGTTADAVLQRYVRETEEYNEALRDDPAKAARFP